jgi:N-acetyl-anhydromuramyl-L-alanine amidase AmpD
MLFAENLCLQNIANASFRIIDERLNNADCVKGVTHRPWDEAWDKAKVPDEERKVKYVVLHYTVCPTVESTYATFNRNGVSSHFVIDVDGTTYCAVDPDTDIAYHAGESYWQNDKSLNSSSVGIEHVNPGFVTDDEIQRMVGTPIYQNIEGRFGRPVQLTGDKTRHWFSFSEDQFNASAQFTRSTQGKFKIPGFAVLTHADIAPGRKSDIGPMYPYKRAFEEYGAGFYPTETHQVVASTIETLSDEVFPGIMRAIGYVQPNTPSGQKEVITAYQLHFSTENISGELQFTTKINLLRHAISLFGHVDLITGTKDEFFRTEFVNLRNQYPELDMVMREHISG